MKRLITLLVILTASACIGEDLAIAKQPNLMSDNLAVLTKRVSVVTDSGVRSLPEGTEIRILSRENGKIKGAAFDTEFEVSESDVTNDIDVAKALEEKRLADKIAAEADLAAKQQTAVQDKANTEIMRQASMLQTQIQKLKAALRASEAEIESLKKIRYASIQRGNSSNSLENRSRSERQNQLEKLTAAQREEIKSLEKQAKALPKVAAN